MISNKTYDTLKMLALLFIPISAFIASMINIFNIPNADVITAVLTAIDTLIGSLVTISKQIWEKNQAELQEKQDNELE